jgi:hypothetical protein
MKYETDIIPTCHTCIHWYYIGIHRGVCKSDEFQVITSNDKKHYVTTRQDFFCAAYSPNNELIDNIIKIENDNDE